MLDAEALESIAALMARLRPFVERRVPSAADANDVLQDVFLRMHRGLPHLRDCERLGPWIYRVVRNAIADRYRQQAREASVAGVDPVASPEELDTEGELAGCLAPFMARLPSPYREAVTLVDVKGVAHKDAASRLGVSLPGMKSRVQRGRRKLRAMFEECCRLEFDVRRHVVGYECRESSCSTSSSESCAPAAESGGARS